MKAKCDEGIHVGPCCAHMVVEYSPTLHYRPTLCPGSVTQSKSDRWVCRSCGEEFVPRSRLDALHVCTSANDIEMRDELDCEACAEIRVCDGPDDCTHQKPHDAEQKP